MRALVAAAQTEMLKARRSRVPWGVTVGFSIAPVVMGLFMVILKDPERARALGLLGAHVQFLALVDIEEKGGGLRPIQFLVAALGLVEQIGNGGLSVRVKQQLDPFVPPLDAGGIAGIELPSVEKRLD